MKEATRAAFKRAIVEEGEKNRDILVFDADLGKSTGSLAFADRFPDRFRDFGIAEQNMIGTAAGASLCGKNVFICSFACFLIGRYETIRMSIAFNRANVKLVGTHSGIGVGEDGYSQQALEDLALMRVTPGMLVLQPADGPECEQMVRYLSEYQGPAYIRLTRHALPVIHGEEYKFEPGKADIVREGEDVWFVASGATVSHCLDAADILSGEGISAAVANIHTIKPIDREFVARLAAEGKPVFTVEDHNVIGGLGGGICETITEGVGGNSVPLRITRLGVPDCFGESAPAEDLYRHFSLDAESLARRVTETLAEEGVPG